MEAKEKRSLLQYLPAKDNLKCLKKKKKEVPTQDQ